jgi:oxygen-dependent protoporphyrinogen oxidase
MPRVVVIGGGISGLAIAYRLRQSTPGTEIIVLECASRPGGTVCSQRLDGFLVEAGPNGFLDTNPATLALCRELGLADQLVPASPGAAKNRYLFLGDRLRRLPASAWQLAGSDLLGWRAKLSILFERFGRARHGFDDESVAEFARRRIGSEAGELFADAAATGIFAGDPELLSAAAAFPRLTAFERQFGSVARGLSAAAKERRKKARMLGQRPSSPQMWSLRNGLGQLIEAIQVRVGPSLRLSATVAGILPPTTDHQRPRWLVRLGTTEPAGKVEADAVVLACPAHRQARMLEEMDSRLAELIGAIPYNRLAVVALGYRRDIVPGDIDGFGYIVPGRLRQVVLGVQWCSSIFPGRAPDGLVLLRAMCGGWHRPEVVDWDDQRLLEAVQAQLAASMRLMEAPVFHRIIRWERAIPQYHIGHLARVTEIEARAAAHPGLFPAGNAYHGVALKDCVEQAAAVAHRVQEFLSGRANRRN